LLGGNVAQPQQRHLPNRCDQIRRTNQPVEELSDVGPLVVVAPTTHNGVRLFYQLLSAHRARSASSAD
jgi:hypothetical protein